MSPDHEEAKINLTKVPLAFAKGGILLKGARWNNEEILDAGTEITEQVIADYQDVSMYIPLSLRGMPTPSATVALVRGNIDAYQRQQKTDKVKDISQAYAEGEDVFVEGDTEDQDCYFLVEGSVDVVINEHKVATISEPGQPIGEMSFLSNEPRSATIRAAEPAKLLRIEKKDQKFLLRTNPTIVKTLMDALVKRLKQTTQKLSDAQTLVDEAEEARAAVERLTVEVERLKTNGRTLAKHTERELGVRKGDYELFEGLLVHLGEMYGAQLDEEPLSGVIELLKEYQIYLASRGLSKVAEASYEYDNMSAGLKEIFGKLGEKREE